MNKAQVLPILLLVSFVWLMTCSEEGGAEYSPADDDQAMEAIARCWLPSLQGGMVLTLWEDFEQSESVESGGCDVAHVVRGGGKGEAHKGASAGGGCSSCPEAVVAFVEGSVEEGPFDGEVSVRGRVILGSDGDLNPYEFPYTIEVETQGDGDVVKIEGEFGADGIVTLRLDGEALEPEEAAKEHRLEPVEVEW
jgi:hypothetical protein